MTLNNKIDACEEVSNNFMIYALDTNNNKAFPDVRDGLRPGARACLWEMYKKGYNSSKPHVKSAKIAGGVAASWWGHGTVAIYETFARMSQTFTNNAPLIDFHGANGNIILGGDAIASDRYTEARLSSITEEYMLKSVGKNTVEMIQNFLQDDLWPKVLPSIFPNLLVNGSQGIGVGLSTYWTTHNLAETCDMLMNYIKTGVVDNNSYYPDFPTGGTIVNKDELAEINSTGRGRIVCEAKYRIKGDVVEFYEMPFQVYVNNVVEEIKEKFDSIPGIKDVSNRCDKDKISLVIECSRGHNPEKIVELLFNSTSLRTQYNVIQNGIVSKTPVLLNLEQTLAAYVEHNIGCIVKEFEYESQVTADRIEILEGLLKTLEDIENIINMIKSNKTATEAGRALIERYGFSNRQTKAILDMKLARLAGLEKIEIEKELKDKQTYYDKCQKVLCSEFRQKTILGKRLSELAAKYGTPRRTEVIQKEIKKPTKKEAPATKCKISLCTGGYIKNGPVDMTAIMEIDCMSNDNLLLVSSLGKLYRLHVSDIKNKIAVGATLKMEPNERIMYIAADMNQTIYMTTKYGMGKATNLQDFVGTTKNVKGMKHFNLAAGDRITNLYNTPQTIKVETANGYSCCVSLSDLTVSRVGKGQKVIALGEGDSVQAYNISTSTKTSKLGSKGRKK